MSSATLTAPSPATPVLASPVLVTPAEAAGTDAVLVDVCTPAEYETAHIPGAVNVLLPLVQEHPGTLATALGGPVVLVRQAGSRARTAHDVLTAAGADQLAVLDGGMNAHTADGQAVRRGRQRWALGRQVRLVAGGIAAGSVLVSIRFPRMRFLAGGIGAGLAGAAVTDTCAMGAALPALPYKYGGSPGRLDDVLPVLGSATTR